MASVEIPLFTGFMFVSFYILALIHTMRSFVKIEQGAVAVESSSSCCMTVDCWSIGFAFETIVVNSFFVVLAAFDAENNETHSKEIPLDLPF